MDKQDLECIICLDLCHECIHCQQCSQILCRRHVARLPEDRCPYCRAAPFRFQENLALQRIISAVRERLGIPEPSPLEDHVPGADSEGSSDEELMPDPRNGTKVPCEAPREGQFQKIPSEEHRARMTTHVQSCTYGGCHRVWSGPWGTFIGGYNGRTHFDLTVCPEGKLLNQLTGWHYQDPRR